MCVCVRVCVCVCVWTCVHACACVCVFVCVCMCKHVCASVCTRARARVCMCKCVCARMCVCLHSLCLLSTYLEYGITHCITCLTSLTPLSSTPPQGDGLKGYDILLQNHKASATASKELMEYLKDRAAVEETYVKSLQRLHKTLLQVTEPAVG